MSKVNAIFFIFLTFSLSIKSQTIEGTVKNGVLVEKNVKISILGTNKTSFVDENGYFFLDNSTTGELTLLVSNNKSYDKKFKFNIKYGLNIIEINIGNPSYDLDQIVVTGTKTNKKKKDSPVIVNLIDSERLNSIQACNLFEGLNFQPGIRVETNCQSCNYTQLRMNGLGGNYSQILINGKSILSPLTGLYGLEQIPVNMIDKIEVVTGGSSALYGSSAVGGIVNIITRKADKNSHNFELHYGLINNSASENIISTNSNILSKSKKIGFSVFTNFRDREFYDHNNDNFSELSKIEDYSIGTNVTINLEKQKIEFNLGNINEYRIGGEMTNQMVEMLQQAEERKHKIYFGNLDYNLDLDSKTSLTSFAAFQYTDRTHFTGVRPIQSVLEDSIYLSNPPFGKSESQVFQSGAQLNRIVKNHTISVGCEIIKDEIFDQIKAYDYLIQQGSTTNGGFIQGDWIFLDKLNILTGLRLDKHSMIDNLILSPRIAFNYKLIDNFQFRFSYGTGYRSPQSFDSDLHMTFSGGGISRIEIDSDLKEERSKSFSSSVNYDLLSRKVISGITLQSFHTTLENTFIQEYQGEDDYGKVFFKTNGQSAKVYGLTFDYRLNFNEKIELESSFTMQRSKHLSGISYSSELEKTKRFLKTPNTYGYLTLQYIHDNKISLAININNTGKMKLIHYAGAPEQSNDEYFKTKPFNTIDLKFSYTSTLSKLKSKLKYSVGVKNITNDYQNDFDSTRNRDSNFIYGPSTPRYIYININYSSL